MSEDVLVVTVECIGQCGRSERIIHNGSSAYDDKRVRRE